METENGATHQWSFNAHFAKYGIRNTLNNALDYVTLANSSFFENRRCVTTANWNIDGLSSVGKSSLSKSMFKTNNARKSNVGIDTSPIDAMCYYFRSMLDRTQFEGKFCDRTPFNNYIWELLWCGLAEYNVTKNLHLDLPFDKWINHAHPTLKQVFVRGGGNIFIVDSNVDSARARLQTRNLGQDAHRALNYELYVEAQNYFYSKLALEYPEDVCLIDLKVLGGDISLLHRVIKEVTCKRKLVATDQLAFPNLVSNQKKPAFTDIEFERLRTANLYFEVKKWHLKYV